MGTFVDRQQPCRINIGILLVPLRRAAARLICGPVVIAALLVLLLLAATVVHLQLLLLPLLVLLELIAGVLSRYDGQCERVGESRRRYSDQPDARTIHL